MNPSTKTVIVRLLPVLLVTAASAAYVFSVEGAGGYAVRNTLPMFVVLLLSLITLYRGRGNWLGTGWCWPLGIVGFAIPAIGLTLYLHHGYVTDLDGMYSGSVYPEAVFRYLPLYTSVAGTIGFAIGWIVGRKV